MLTCFAFQRHLDRSGDSFASARSFKPFQSKSLPNKGREKTRLEQFLAVPPPHTVRHPPLKKSTAANSNSTFSPQSLLVYCDILRYHQRHRHRTKKSSVPLSPCRWERPIITPSPPSVTTRTTKTSLGRGLGTALPHSLAIEHLANIGGPERAAICHPGGV